MMPINSKLREPVLYLFFGCLTTSLNIVGFWVLVHMLSVDALISNAIMWVICVLFAFYTNKTWVFTSETECKTIPALFKFCLGRLATLAAEEILLFIGIYKINANTMFVKILAEAFVIVSNFVISKFIVFGSKQTKQKVRCDA